MSQARRLYVHIGLQKTGTSYLQAAMLRSRAAMASGGTDLVPPTKREAFELAVVVRDRYGARRDEVSDRNTLTRFTRQLREAPGDVAVLSQESFAAAGPAQVERLLAAAEDREVHVVATVRDLARQLASSWQQALKTGGTADFPTYLRRLRSLERAGSAAHPWIHLDPPVALARWAEAVTAARVHVVTVPPTGGAPTLLLERFARVIGLDPALLEPEDRQSNSSLGLAQAEVLRRVNLELPEEVHRRYVYADVVKRAFAADVLGAQEPRRILVPARFRPWCEDVGARQVAAIAAAGYRVEGALADLGCADSTFAVADDRLSEQEVAASSVAAITTILAERGSVVAARRSGRFRVAESGRVGRLRRRLLSRR